MKQPPDVLEWIQLRLTGNRKERYVTALDMFYATARLADGERAHDRRWDEVFPRTFMFKRYFKLIKAHSTAVQMVEIMRHCGITPYVLETLPEAVVVPLRDAISLCQPHPPTGWSTDLLDLVNRSDISLLRKPGQKPRAAIASILVRSMRILPLSCA
jgi:anaphase-promoting complex subunit 1